MAVGMIDRQLGYFLSNTPPSMCDLPAGASAEIRFFPVSHPLKRRKYINQVFLSDSHPGNGVLGCDPGPFGQFRTCAIQYTRQGGLWIARPDLRSGPIINSPPSGTETSPDRIQSPPHCRIKAVGFTKNGGHFLIDSSPEWGYDD